MPVLATAPSRVGRPPPRELLRLPAIALGMASDTAMLRERP